MHHNNGYKYAIALFAFSILGCQYFKSKPTVDQTQAVARVYDKYLFKNDLIKIIPKGASAADSMQAVRNYIDNWIKQNIILRKAENNLNDDEKNVQPQLDNYRNTLITYIYQRELIKEKLDTTVTENEITEYYQTHKNNFALRQSIVRFIYLKTDKAAPKLNQVRQWFKSNNNDDKIKLEDYCYQFATDYFLNDEDWVSIDQCLQKAGIITDNKDAYLQSNFYTEIPDSTQITFIRIKEFKYKDSISPIEFETDNIKNLIINKRKLGLIQEMEKAAYQKALNEKDFEIYTQ
ncbi:MAG: hypothetical protein JNK61_05345 [Bacteroidia bacterium]|nr:hypothetical protein [Bacteroidia bacterium]HQV01214.1 hypothetical protein [Bacteroidia bacterium]